MCSTFFSDGDSMWNSVAQKSLVLCSSVWDVPLQSFWLSFGSLNLMKRISGSVSRENVWGM